MSLHQYHVRVNLKKHLRISLGLLWTRWRFDDSMIEWSNVGGHERHPLQFRALRENMILLSVLDWQCWPVVEWIPSWLSGRDSHTTIRPSDNAANPQSQSLSTLILFPIINKSSTKFSKFLNFLLTGPCRDEVMWCIQAFLCLVKSWCCWRQGTSIDSWKPPLIGPFRTWKPPILLR